MILHVTKIMHTIRKRYHFDPWLNPGFKSLPQIPTSKIKPILNSYFPPRTISTNQYHYHLLFRYYSALAHTGLLALTAPYLDLGGAGVVVTASRALYRGEPSHLHYTNDEVLGVIGADFPLSYFHR